MFFKRFVDVNLWVEDVTWIPGTPYYKVTGYSTFNGDIYRR